MCDPVFGCEPLPQVALVDWDSTINNFDEHMLGSINARFRTNIQPADLTSWDSLRAGANALTRQQEKFAWGKDVFGSATWNDGLQPLPGALSALWRMLDLGMQIHVISARPASHERFLADWLGKYGLANLVTHGCIQGGKIDYARSVGAGVAFDDSPRQICQLAEQCPVYVIQRPYNRDPHLCRGSLPAGGAYGLLDVGDFAASVADLLKVTGYADQVGVAAGLYLGSAVATVR